MSRSSAVTSAVKARNTQALTRALAGRVGGIPPGAVVDAGRLAWQPGLALLVKHGADLNVSAQHYRALHALIQEKPHVGGSSTPERVACLEWMVAHGADPELTGAWPDARATIIAAFVGVDEYVRVLREGRGPADIFVAAALGDARRVAAILDKDARLAVGRDHGQLTSLQCCGGSRLGAARPKVAEGLLRCARMLVDAGADVNAWTRSYAHDVSVAYFVIHSGQVAMLEYLLGRGLDATAAIAPAAWDGRADILDLLIRHGAKINEAKDAERPVLNELVRWGRFAHARLLVARGADPNVADAKGWTALHQAASRGNVGMVKDLIAAGGDPKRPDRVGLTPGDIGRKKKVLVAVGSTTAGKKTKR